MISFDKNDLARLEKNYRTTFINCLSGFKSGNLIATKSLSGQLNLAVFSSVIHLGSDPALIGFITRPITVDRHTYQNIRESKLFTVNHISNVMKERAHQTSARYPDDISEFDTCKFTAEYLSDFDIPYVQESPIKMACAFVEEVPINANSTLLIVASIERVYVQDELLGVDGSLDLAKGKVVTISGLDSYHGVEAGVRYAYAKPDVEIRRIN